MAEKIKIAELERFIAESHGYPEDFALDYEAQGVPAGLAALLRLARAAKARDAAYEAMQRAPLRDPQPGDPESEKVQALLRYAPPYDLYQAYNVACDEYDAALAAFDFEDSDG